MAVAAVLAVVVAGAVVALRSDPSRTPLTAAARGDAGRTGIFAAAVAEELQTRRWRDRWTLASPRDLLPPVAPVAVGDDVVVEVTGAVARLDGATGAIEWRVEPDAGGTRAPLLVDDRFLAVAGAGEVTLLDVVDGTRLWSTPVPDLGPQRALAAVGRTLVVVGETGSVVLLDLARGERTATLLARDLLGGRGPFASDPVAVPVGDHVAVQLRGRGAEHATAVLLTPTGEVVWVSDVAVRPWTTPVAGDGVLLTADDQGIVALDATTGRAAWRWRAAAGEDPASLVPAAVTPDRRRVLVTSSWPIRRVLDTDSGALVVSENAAPLRVDRTATPDADGRLAAVTTEGRVEVVDVANGRTLAAVALPGGSPAVPAIAGERLVVGSTGGVVSSRPLGPGAAPTGGGHGWAPWTAEVTPVAACPVVAGGDTVLVAADTLRAHDAGDGARRWTTADGVAPVVGEVAAAGGVVVSVDLAGFASARDVATGEPRWRAPVGGQALGTPVVAGGTVVAGGGTGPGLGGGGRSGYLRALALEDGRRRWFVNTDGHLTLPPAVAGDLVVVATATGTLQGFDVATGTERWRHTLDGAPVAPPVVRGDVVVVATAAGVATLRAGASAVEKLAATALHVPLRRAPAVTADTIVLRVDGATVAALDLHDHTSRWEQPVDDVTTTPPTIAGDRVLVGGQRGVHVLGLADGDVRGLVGVGAVVGQLSVTGAGVVSCTAAGELLVHG